MLKKTMTQGCSNKGGISNGRYMAKITMPWPKYSIYPFTHPMEVIKAETNHLWTPSNYTHELFSLEKMNKFKVGGMYSFIKVFFEKRMRSILVTNNCIN
jgi:hypothetical protein